jgi:hypothetical protein
MVSLYVLLWFYLLTQSGRGESQDADCANHDCTWLGEALVYIVRTALVALYLYTLRNNQD